MIDRHYTPPDLAERALAACCVGFNPRTAADFTAGEGALLSAVRRRWPSCEVFANDTDSKALTRLSTLLDGAKLSSSNFLNPRSRAGSPLLRQARKSGVDLIVLNPPFSNRGGQRRFAALDQKTVSCGTAMAFVVAAIPYLAPDGRLLAILPTSCLTSERDEAAVELIRQRFDITELLPRTKESFRGCSVEVTGILIQQRGKIEAPGTIRSRGSALQPKVRADLFRGTIPAKSPERSSLSYSFVHTTNLRNQTIDTSSIRRLSPTYVIDRPSVLVPRVGRPTLDKICVFDGHQSIVLSDCVFAILVETGSMANAIHKLICSQWDALATAYVGSCAPYLTRVRLKEFLATIGVDAQTVRGIGVTTSPSASLAA